MTIHSDVSSAMATTTGSGGIGYATLTIGQTWQIQRKEVSMISWHYTTGDKYELIKKSGLLLPADIGVCAPERPILWFSTHPKFEPTAMKPLCDERGFIRMLALEELHEMAGGLVRFGCPVSRLKFGENLRSEAKMKSKVWRGLAKSAEKVKATQSDWWGHVGSMEIAELTVELMSSRMTWRPEDA